MQERDLALHRLQHRRDTLGQRDALARGDAEAAGLASRIQQLTAQRDALAREEARLDGDARGLQDKAKDVEARMYSGEVTSPRELQAMQADVEQLRRHQRELENRELEVMEQREPLDAAIVDEEARGAKLLEELSALRAELAGAEREIDAEITVERDARAALTAVLDPALVADYERRRAKAGGMGVARLVGTTCQGCHLSIPSTEVDRIRHAADGAVASCDNCGCILVP